MIDTSALRELLDDNNMINKYIVIFRKDAMITMDNLKESVLNHEWGNASIHAHSLKSQLQYLNEHKLADQAYHLEIIFSKIPDDSKENFETLIYDFNTLLSDLMSRIDKYLKKETVVSE